MFTAWGIEVYQSVACWIETPFITVKGQLFIIVRQSLQGKPIFDCRHIAKSNQWLLVAGRWWLGCREVQMSFPQSAILGQPIASSTTKLRLTPTPKRPWKTLAGQTCAAIYFGCVMMAQIHTAPLSPTIVTCPSRNYSTTSLGFLSTRDTQWTLLWRHSESPAIYHAWLGNGAAWTRPVFATRRISIRI